MSESTCPDRGCIDGPMIEGQCLEHYIEPFLPLAAVYKPRTKAPAIVRFLHHADLSGGPDACWTYTNSVHPAGYAIFFDKDTVPKLQKAHRWAYKHFTGQPIPEGATVACSRCTDDCPERGWGDPHHRCVNPRHLVCNGPVRYSYNCARCGGTFTRTEPAKGKRAYCSPECLKNRVTKTCPVCGREFSVPRSNDERYQTCSMACKNKDTEYVNCERCGKRFAWRHRTTKRHCSEACKRPPQPPLMVSCENCGKEFQTHPSDVNRRFCSVPCVRQYMGETKLEARIRVALELLGVGFAQEYPFGRWSIDFAIPSRKVAIEADGDYWHTILAERDARRDAKMNEAGWTVIRLAEGEVNAARNLGQFILARIHEATGLELADIAGPAITGSRQSRPVFRLRTRRDRARPAKGQMPLWS